MTEYTKPRDDEEKTIFETSDKIRDTFREFGVYIGKIHAHIDARFVRYELTPGAGVNYAKIKRYMPDLEARLGKVARLAPPNEGYIIEIQRPEPQVINITDCGKDKKQKLPVCVGGYVTKDLAAMPHLLIAGATNSGKSVCVNAIITSILIMQQPQDCRLVLIDPKQVELSQYKNVPHLIGDILTTPQSATRALNSLCETMEWRYTRLEKVGARNIDEYNARAAQKLPRVVVVIDELADLMLQARREIEPLIVRLAQKARAAGIHLVVATQEPTVNVITGLIKANMPSRIAFKTATAKESVVILGHGGAEKLLGNGDMIFQAANANTAERLQGVYVSNDFIEDITSRLKRAYRAA